MIYFMGLSVDGQLVSAFMIQMICLSCVMNGGNSGKKKTYIPVSMNSDAEDKSMA